MTNAAEPDCPAETHTATCGDRKAGISPPEETDVSSKWRRPSWMMPSAYRMMTGLRLSGKNTTHRRMAHS